MLNERKTAVQLVASDLLASEPAVDEASAALAKLYNSMFTAKHIANLGVQIGREAFSLVSQAIYHQGQAREHVLAAHKALQGVSREVLPARLIGDEGCPPSASISQIASLVPDEAANA